MVGLVVCTRSGPADDVVFRVEDGIVITLPDGGAGVVFADGGVIPLTPIEGERPTGR